MMSKSSNNRINAPKEDGYEPKNVSDIIKEFNAKIANERKEVEKKNKGPPVAPKPNIKLLKSISSDEKESSVTNNTEQYQDNLQAPENVNSGRSSLVSEDSDNENESNHIKKHKSEHAARELLSTEETFIKQVRLLDVILEKCKETLAHNPELVNSIKLIFRDIKPLLTFHEQLLEKIKQCIERDFWEIPEVFLQKDTQSLLKLYKAFLAQYEANNYKLNKLMTMEKEFKEICEVVRKESEFILQDCCAHYFAVFSRLQRYELLFKEFKKDLSQDSPILPKAEKVLALVKEIMQNSEHALSDQSHFLETKSIFDQIEGHLNDIQNTTRMVKHGPAFKISRRFDSVSERYLFLFSDRFLICDPMNHLGKYKLKKKEIVLFSIKLKQIEEDDVVKPHSFRIEATEQTFDLCYSSADEKQEWWDSLQSAVKRDRELMNRLTDNKIDDQKLGEQAPVWARDSQSSMCMRCAVKFTTLNRRHHCRACGKLVCAECSNKKLFLKFADNKKRTCRDCYCLLTGTSDEKPKVIKELKTNENEVTRGYLFYRSFMNKLWSNAKRVYCVYFKDSSLYIYEKQKDLQPMSVHVTLGFQVSAPDNMEPNAILLNHSSSTLAHYFLADTPEIMNRWLKSFEEVLSTFESHLKKEYDIKPAEESEQNDPVISDEKSRSTTEEEFDNDEEAELNGKEDVAESAGDDIQTEEVAAAVVPTTTD